MRATSIKLKGTWSGNPIDRVTLDYDGRHRRRLALVSDGGTRFLLDLVQTTVLSNGDALVLEDGNLIEVNCALETLIEVNCPDQKDLTRIAWHLGNRHLPTEISGNSLWIRSDHVIEEMLKSLGAEVRKVSKPFQPERGAYDEAHNHG
jgi:urease accessory protein